ncbi:MAG: hypothetical protein AAGA55_11920 [Planctomycetota bacterium]
MDEQGGIPGAWIAAVYGSLGILCGVAAMRGILTSNDTWVLAGLLGLVVTLAALPLALRKPPSGTGSDPRLEKQLHEIRAQIRGMTAAVESMQETMVLSDDARRVLNRSRERDLLCKAIQEDINSEDWDAAMVLIRELAERFGYRADAEGFRQKVETARFTTVDRRVTEAIRSLDEMMARSEWEDALAEAARIARLFPDSPKVEGLRHRVSATRDRFKVDLERRFLHAAQADRVEEAMDLLHELDQYLSEAEAQQFREVARGVIGKARDNLGAQFKLAIQDRMWAHAEEIGEKIIAEFPNSRMAEEVREMIDTIRERAGVARKP